MNGQKYKHKTGIQAGDEKSGYSRREKAALEGVKGGSGQGRRKERTLLIGSDKNKLNWVNKN